MANAIENRKKVKGVEYNPKTHSYYAYGKLQGKKISLGTFYKLSHAKIAVRKFEKENPNRLKEGPYICLEHCGKEFKSGAGLALHIRQKDGTHPPPKSKGKKLTGKQLEIRLKSFYKTKPWLKSPTGNVKKVDLVCPQCGKKFKVLPSRVNIRKYCSLDCAHIGHKNRIVSAETRKRQSIARKKLYKKNPKANPFYGRTPTNYQGWGYGGFCEEDLK